MAFTFNPEDPAAGTNRDEGGRFTSKAKQLDIITKRAQELGKAYAASSKSVEQLNASLTSSQKTAQRQVDDLTSSFKRQLNQLQSHDRGMQGLTRSTQSMTASLLRAGAAVWAFHAAWKAVSHLIETKMGVAMLAGPANIKGLDSRQLTMLGQLLQSPSLRFGARQPTIAASGKLTTAVQGLGDEGLKAVNDFVRTLEPKAQQAFINAVNSQGVRAAVNQYTSGQNYGAADTLRNALDVAGAGKGQLDPLLEAAKNLQVMMERLTAAVEKLAGIIASSPFVQTAVSFAADHPLLALGAGAAGLIGGKAALTRGLPWAIRAAMGVGGGAGAAGAATAATTAAAGSATATAGGGAGGLTLAGVGGAALTGIGLGGAALGAGMGIGYLSERGNVLEALGREANVSQRMQGITSGLLGSDDARKRLLGQREQLAAQIKDTAVSGQTSFVARFFGADDLTDAAKANISSLQTALDALNRQIEATTTSVSTQTAAQQQAAKATEAAAKAAADLDAKRRQQFATHQQAILESATAASAVPIAQQAMVQQQQFAGLTEILNRIQLSPEQRAYQAAIQRQIDALQNELSKIDLTSEATKEQATQDANRIAAQIAGLRGEQKAIQKQQLDLGEKDYGDKLTLMRQQLQIAEATPIGWLGAGKELHELQDALQKEIQRLNDQLARINQSTAEGQRQARQAEIQRNQLILELKQSRLQELQALLDNAVGQAAQAGRFSKIIYDKNQNLEAGIRKGVVNYDQRVVGSVAGAPEGWMPRTMSEVIRARDAEQGNAQPKRGGGGGGGAGGGPTTHSNDPASLLRTGIKWLEKVADAMDSQRDVEDLFDPSAGHHLGARGGNVIGN